MYKVNEILLHYLDFRNIHDRMSTTGMEKQANSCRKISLMNKKKSKRLGAGGGVSQIMTGRGINNNDFDVRFIAAMPNQVSVLLWPPFRASQIY